MYSALRWKLMLFAVLVCLAVGAEEKPAPATPPGEIYDLVVYGGTAGGIASAVAAVQEGAHVIVLEPTNHVGGMLTGGLGWTDKGIEASIGGLSRQFYKLVYEHYEKPEAWRWETREEYLGRSGEKTMVNAQGRKGQFLGRSGVERDSHFVLPDSTFAIVSIASP